MSGGRKRSDAEFHNLAVSESMRAIEWQSGLILTQNKNPKPVLANAIHALRTAPDWRAVLSYNEFALVVVMRRPTPWAGARCGCEWTDHEDRLTAEWLQQQGILVSADIAGQAVEVVARENAFHPVREYLESLKWDGRRRIDEWLNQYLGVEISDYSMAVGARWLIAAVARVMDPGCKVDTCLILEGEQGIGKSTVFKILAGSWFTDELHDLGTKDAAMQTLGVWIIELAELDVLGRAESTRTKAFLSRCTDRYRPPYGRRVVAVPRQCVFGGSVNRFNYLKDETGGRRFWPVRCRTPILVAELEGSRDQLWAEAVERYRAGDRWWLETKELCQRAEEEQQARYEGDPWEERIAEFIGSRDDVSMEEILSVCLNKDGATWSQSDKNRVSKCLTALGWVGFQRRVGHNRLWRYRSARRGVTGD